MTSLVLPPGLFSYPKVFRSELPRDPKPTDKKAWSVTYLVTRDAMGTPEMRTAIEALLAAARERFGPTVSNEIKFNEKGHCFVYVGDPANGDTIRLPFRNDARKKGYPEEIAFFFNARKVDDPEKNIRPPEVVDRYGKPITDPREIYAGVQARISVGVFAYTERGNKGVSFGLNNVQKLGDGPRLDNSKSASEEFPTETAPAAMPGDSPAGPTTAADLSGFLSG